MHQVHDGLWKGAITTAVGFGAATYGFAGKLLFASTFFDPTATSPSPAEIIPVSMADWSAIIGSVMTVGGGLWTWFLLQKAKKQDIEREQRKKEEDAERECRVADERAEIRIMLERGLAELHLKHEEMAVQVQKITDATEKPK